MEIDSDKIPKDVGGEQQPQEEATASTSSMEVKDHEEKMSPENKEKKWVRLEDSNKLEEILQRNGQISEEVNEVLENVIVGLKMVGGTISEWDENDEEKAQAILDKLKRITRPRSEVRAEQAAEAAAAAVAAAAALAEAAVEAVAEQTKLNN